MVVDEKVALIDNIYRSTDEHEHTQVTHTHTHITQTHIVQSHTVHSELTQGL